MKYHTFCIVAGSEACNARCPWCVAGMTPNLGVPAAKPPVINRRNFEIACRMAQLSMLDTARITGKGEPTIFPEMISEYLRLLQPFNFPMVELQTNGILISRGKPVTGAHLEEWYQRGMTHVCVSVVSYDPEKNRQNYTPHEKDYIDLPGLIRQLHCFGFNVRLTCILQKGCIDSAAELQKLLDFCREHQVEQLSCLPVNKPVSSRDGKLYESAIRARPDDEQLKEIYGFAHQGTKLNTLPWGAEVFDLRGQNLCLTSCLTTSPESDDSRQLIFLPPGRIAADWQYEGAVILDHPREHVEARPAEPSPVTALPETPAQ